MKFSRPDDIILSLLSLSNCPSLEHAREMQVDHLTHNHVRIFARAHCLTFRINTLNIGQNSVDRFNFVVKVGITVADLWNDLADGPRRVSIRCKQG